MVTPLGTSKQSKFPLFERLLSESRKLQPKEPNNNLVCPATAPAVFHMDSVHHEEETGCNKQRVRESGFTEIPIVLQDPPKSKLKRQLSIATKESTEALLVRKKAFVDKEHAYTETDEVDGDQPKKIQEREIIAEGKPTSSQDVSQPKVISGTLTSDSCFVRPDSSKALEQRRLKGLSSISDVVCKETEYLEQKSPNLFNLSDIGLTSPFVTHTHNGAQAKEREVFVFPENASPKKPSPYKPYRGDDTETTHTSERSTYPKEFTNKYMREERREVLDPASDKLLSRHETEAQARYSTSQSHMSSYKAEKKLSKQESETEATYGLLTQGQSHVSPRGFIWPETATLTDPIPFSPRIVNTSAKPRFPTVSPSTSRTKSPYDQYEEDLERLRILEREYARAKAIYDSPPTDRSKCPLSPTHRNVEILRRGTLRSFSDIDRSPNEKDIKETNDDVRNRYERSISDPRFSPRQVSGLLQRPSPLAKPYEGISQEASAVSREKYRDPFREDVRRRLFMKSDSTFDYRRQQSSHSYSQVTTDIPEEVLQFLHSRNFHPEELENLKEFLRRGGSPKKDEGSYYSPSSTYLDDSAEEQDRYGHVLHRGSLHDKLHESTVRRDRRHGEIDIRLSCEEVVEKKKLTEELLRELDHDSGHCKCAQIEKEIWLMAMDAYSKIRRADRSAEAHDQFQAELHETHENIYSSMRVLCGIKCLCKYGRTLEEMFPGSVVFRLRCPNVDALLDLWHAYKSGDLLRQLTDAFISKELLERFDCENIKLKLSIDWNDYLDCKQELESLTDSGVVLTPIKSPLTPIHCRSRSEPASVTKQANQILQPKTNMSPFRERILSDSSVELSPRRAFQELNSSRQSLQPKPQVKKLTSDSVFVDDANGAQRSPLTPGRKKTFVFEANDGQENVNKG